MLEEKQLTAVITKIADAARGTDDPAGVAAKLATIFWAGTITDAGDDLKGALLSASKAAMVATSDVAHAMSQARRDAYSDATRIVQTAILRCMVQVLAEDIPDDMLKGAKV